MTDTYSTITHFSSGLNESQLKEIVQTQLPTCTDVGDVVNIVFSSQISQSEKTILDNIISNYTYVPPPSTASLYLTNDIVKSDISNSTFTFLGCLMD